MPCYHKCIDAVNNNLDIPPLSRRIGVVGSISIVRPNQRNGQLDRFRPYPASVVQVHNGRLRRELASIENRTVFAKVERAQVRHELVNFSEIANYTGNEHLEAVGYGTSGILGIYLSKNAAIKIQLKYVNANRQSSDIYFNSTSIILRPTTHNGSEIELGGDTALNPWCSWVFFK